MDVAGFYDVVHRRRDVRGEFTGVPVPTEVLRRILGAAHIAPSVGLSQPWDFVLVRDVDTRTAFRDHVQAEREIFASQLDEERASAFARIKSRGCWSRAWEEFLRELLGIPTQVRPVAWLCLGPVATLAAAPDVERHGWRHRTPLAKVVHEERFEGQWQALLDGPDLAAGGPA